MDNPFNTPPQPANDAYLRPYLKAAAEHGAGFRSLLWASPQTQSARFAAFARAFPLEGKRLLDAGCGRADLLDFLLSRNLRPAHYTGMEAVPALANAAKRKPHPNYLVVQADFVREPLRLFAGADVLLFSGSLNTLDAPTFYQTLRTALAAANQAVVFNFLANATLAAADYLTWHSPTDVLAFARTLTPKVSKLDDYLDGDVTIAMEKTSPF